jgi:DnaK suppressor protein
MSATRKTGPGPKARRAAHKATGSARPACVAEAIPPPTPKRTTARRKPAERIDPQWRTHFRRLVELRDHLLQEKRDLYHDALEERPAFSMHMADAGTDSYDRDFALGILSHEQDAVYEIEEALDRIRNGTYGICEMTGKRIPAARLEAIPWTRFTAAAECRFEKKGAFQRARLGVRETSGRNPPGQSGTSAIPAGDEEQS